MKVNGCVMVMARDDRYFSPAVSLSYYFGFFIFVFNGLLTATFS